MPKKKKKRKTNVILTNRLPNFHRGAPSTGCTPTTTRTAIATRMNSLVKFIVSFWFRTQMHWESICSTREEISGWTGWCCSLRESYLKRRKRTIDVSDRSRGFPRYQSKHHDKQMCLRNVPSMLLFNCGFCCCSACLWLDVYICLVSTRCKDQTREQQALLLQSICEWGITHLVNPECRGCARMRT